MNTRESFYDIIPQEAEEILESIGLDVLIDDNLGAELEGFRLIDTSGREIARIYQGSFFAGDEEKEHIGIEVSEDWRRKSVASKLYQLWEIFGFELPSEEYTRDPEKIPFLESIGYQVVRILDASGEEYDNLEEGTYAELIK